MREPRKGFSSHFCPVFLERALAPTPSAQASIFPAPRRASTRIQEKSWPHDPLRRRPSARPSIFGDLHVPWVSMWEFRCCAVSGTQLIGDQGEIESLGASSRQFSTWQAKSPRPEKDIVMVFYRAKKFVNICDFLINFFIFCKFLAINSTSVTSLQHTDISTYKRRF